MSKASTRVSARDRLLTSLDETIRKLGAQAVLISDLVATRVGLNSTDLECLDLLHLAGPTTAGQVSAHSGLTTGATTAMIDRLERAGFVRRRRDSGDRRVVVVEVKDHCMPHIAPLYERLKKDLDALHARYNSRELATVVRYLAEALEAGARHVAWLQTQPSHAKHPARLHHMARGPLSQAKGRPPQEHRRASTRRKKRALQESTS
jgi:DNA-binding MarR family transcriptional regulator